MTPFESLSALSAWLADGSGIVEKWPLVRQVASDPSTTPDHLRVLAVVQPHRVLANPAADSTTVLAIATEYPAVMNEVLRHPALRDSRDDLISCVRKGKTFDEPSARLACGIAVAADFEPALLLLVQLHERYRWLLAHRPHDAWNGNPDRWIERWLDKIEGDHELDAPVTEVVVSSPFFDREHARRAFETLSRVCPEPFDIHPRVSALFRHHPVDAVRATLDRLPGLSVHAAG